MGIRTAMAKKMSWAAIKDAFSWGWVPGTGVAELPWSRTSRTGSIQILLPGANRAMPQNVAIWMGVWNGTPVIRAALIFRLPSYVTSRRAVTTSSCLAPAWISPSMKSWIGYGSVPVHSGVLSRTLNGGWI